jgi:hypothetical protein
VSDGSNRTHVRVRRPPTVMDREELFGRESRGSRIPQYLIRAMLGAASNPARPDLLPLGDTSVPNSAYRPTT